MGVANNHLEFMRLVAEMRKAQNEYFKFKYSATLQRAKGLERQVDEYLARHLKHGLESSADPVQQQLFD
jgi:hypothetical protein